jgi:hypothetical protein
LSCSQIPDPVLVASAASTCFIAGAVAPATVFPT